jgi:hypothetical protein
MFPLKNPEAPVYPILRLFLSRMGVSLDRFDPADAAIDWNKVAPLLRRFRLRPVAYWTAASSARDIEPALQEELESAFYSAALRRDRLNSALDAIAKAFARCGIPAILLKGAALADSLYPHPACRPMEDIDLLVRPTDHAGTGRLLVELGYSDTAFGPEDFRNPETGITVDLHVELLNATRLPVRRKAWQPDLDAWRRRSVPVPGFPHLCALSPGDQFEYLCQHFWLHHGLQSPRGMIDICLAAERLGLPRAQTLVPPSWEGNRGIWHTLGACAARLGLTLPEKLLRRFRPGKIGWVERWAHWFGTRGLLPDVARYGYLLTALQANERRELYRQCFWAASARRRTGT